MTPRKACQSTIARQCRINRPLGIRGVAEFDLKQVRLAWRGDWNNHHRVHARERSESPRPEHTSGLEHPIASRTVGRPLIWAGVLALLLGVSFGWIMSMLGH